MKILIKKPASGFDVLMQWIGINEWIYIEMVSLVFVTTDFFSNLHFFFAIVWNTYVYVWLILCHIKIYPLNDRMKQERNKKLKRFHDMQIIFIFKFVFLPSKYLVYVLSYVSKTRCIKILFHTLFYGTQKLIRESVTWFLLVNTKHFPLASMDIWFWLFKNKTTSSFSRRR